MKHLSNKAFILTMLGVLLLSTHAIAQLDLPRGSQMAQVSQKIGITNTVITYSRPSVKERKVWGGLVPFGMNNLGFGTAKESPWRAGANENTTIKFTDNVKVEGQELSAGKYGLHMVIREDGRATLIFSKNNSAWGSYFYEPNDDVLRVEVRTKEINHTEQLTYEFTEVDANSVVIALNWEKKQIPFKIEVDVATIVLADIRQKLQNAPGFNRQTWEQAATYALNNDGDLNEAMSWVDNAIAGQFYSQKTFSNMSIKSQILQKMGKKDEALSMVDEMTGMASMTQLNTLSYQLLNLGEHKKALKLFKLNVKNNPKNANVYDSLGEAYKTIGDKKNAIKNLKKSLSLNPSPALKANTIKQLKELGVDV